jgi:DNA-directed RNA polymerase specialized sigma24 family protein
VGQKKFIIRAVGTLILVWTVVWAIRAYAGSRKITAERLNREISRVDFADWSDRDFTPDGEQARQRREKLREIADMMNRLDFQEREKNRRNHTAEAFFRKLSRDEKSLFIDLTVRESMSRFMEALDKMPPDQRRKFVEQGLKEVQNGLAGDEMARAEQLDSDLLDKISQEGMRAYFEQSSAQTKLDLAPLMEAVNETMQGLRGNEFRPSQQ